MVEQPKFEQFHHEFAQIEFAANVHIMFISRFLNSNARLVLTPEERKCDANGNVMMSLNLDNEIEIMSKCLAYFDTWKAWCMDQKTEDMYTKWRVKKRDQLFISSITFRNLKICIGVISRTQDRCFLTLLVSGLCPTFMPIKVPSKLCFLP